MVVSFRGALGSGKTTLADYLVKEYGYTRLAFADPLKLEVFAFLQGQDAAAEAAIWTRYRAETKDDGAADLFPVPDFDLKLHNGSKIHVRPSLEEKMAWMNTHKDVLRPLVQWWGTEYRRAQDPNYWTSQMQKRIDEILNQGGKVVVDDCRFPNEWKLLTQYRALDIMVFRPANLINRAPGIVGHQSETGLPPQDYPYHFGIHNNGDLDTLFDIVRTIINSAETACTTT